MTSKEWIKGVIYNLEMLEMANESISKDLRFDTKMQKEAYNQVLKDLEDYEELKNLMGTPIQDIMKRLKVLEILKPYFSGAVFPSAINFNFSEEKWKPIKEWLENDRQRSIRNC